MRAARGAGALTRLVLWMFIGLTGGLALAAGAPALFGYHSFTVLTGSMVPTLGVGDVVVTKPIAARDARVSDVITFPDPENRTRLITHRIRSIHMAGERAMVVTQGDANNHAEHWAIAQTGTVGRVTYHLPLIGYALVWTRGRFARLGLVVIPALLLGMLELGRIWRPRRPEHEAFDAAT
ncbi:MAG: signal peptidase [Thermoleophilaceae bacterium]|jgi:signal peptidase|nr:signal peptidase [Thermoleophilaceae bacterium]